MTAADLGPLVRDTHGLPVGVHIDAAGTVDDSPFARLLRRLDALRKTRELEGQDRLRGETRFSAAPRR
jgi:hypothetical protein